MKSDIIKVRSTLGKKRKRNFSKNKNKIIKININTGKSEKQMIRLKAVMIIIPIIISVIIIVGLFFVIKEFSYVSFFNNNEVSESAVAVTNITQNNDSKKLITVVSPDNELPQDYILNLVEYQNIKIDRLAFDGLTGLMNDAKKENLSLNIISGYISEDDQNRLYEEEVNRLITQEKYSKTLAETETEKNIPKGNFADSQTGLSVTFSSNNSKNFETTKEYKWLVNNSIKYGFVLRYSKSKEYETNMNFNPCLFRYVGIDNATKMRTLNMCLDEYNSYISSRDY